MEPALVIPSEPCLDVDHNSKHSANSFPRDFCEQCRAVFCGQLDAKGGPHHETVQSLQTSVFVEDCYICCYIWNVIENGAWSNAADNIPATEFEVDSGWHSESLTLSFSRPGLPPSKSARFLLFPTSLSNNTGEEYYDTNPLEINTSIGKGTDSIETWNLVCDWLETCNPEFHPRCHPPKPVSESRRTPSRLLDLYHPKGVGLVSFADCSQTPPKYTTLSHRWGHIRLITLTSKSSSQLFAGIGTSALPSTFRDAINFTRKLGIRYIWIDSLCIYQDNFSDWQTEAAKMGDIYSGSYCNLGATAAENSSQGLYHKSEKYTSTRRLAEARNIRATWTSKENLDLIQPGDYALCIKDFWNQGMTSQPLLERGWVVQERWLAPRTIHFSQPQVFWECSHRIACELYPKRLPADAGVFDDLSLVWKGAHHKPPRIASRYDRTDRPPIISGLSYYLDDQPVDQWQALVEKFSECKLTMERDKLPALSGVANHIAGEGSRGRYFAGLWERDFARQLLWFVLEENLIQRPMEYRAPSWSWAALDCPILHFTFPRGELVPHMEIVAVDTLPNQIEMVHTNIRINPCWYVKIKAPLHLATATVTTSDKSKEHSVQVWGTDIDVTTMVYWDSSTPPIKPTKVWILPIWYHKSDTCNPFMRGLLLKPVPTSSRGTFERVGMIALDLDTDEDYHVIARGSDLVNEKDYEEYEWKDANKEKKVHLYTITIL